MGHRMKCYIASAALLFVYTVRDVTNLKDFSENEILEFEFFRLAYFPTSFYYACDIVCIQIIFVIERNYVCLLRLCFVINIRPPHW